MEDEPEAAKSKFPNFLHEELPSGYLYGDEDTELLASDSMFMIMFMFCFVSLMLKMNIGNTSLVPCILCHWKQIATLAKTSMLTNQVEPLRMLKPQLLPLQPIRKNFNLNMQYCYEF